MEELLHQTLIMGVGGTGELTGAEGVAEEVVDARFVLYVLKLNTHRSRKNTAL